MTAADPPGADAYHEALAAFARILAARPEKSGHDFAEAVTSVCAYRDAMIAARGRAERSPAEQARLETVNAVISVLIAGHFPLGSIPWDDIAGAERAFAALGPAETEARR